MKTLCRIGLWFLLRLRIYFMWSKVYMWIYDRKYRSVPLPEFANLNDLQQVAGAMVWRADGPRELWDAFSDPHATWARHRNGESAGDCDDISAFIADRVLDLVSMGALVAEGITMPYQVNLLTVVWYDPDKKRASGHNLCLVQYVDATRPAAASWDVYGHLSNWNNAALIGPFDTIEDAVRDVAGGREVIGWAVTEPGTFKLRKYGSGV